MYEKTMVSTVLYGAETWGFNLREKGGLSVMEMKCIGRVCDVTIRDRIWN